MLALDTALLAYDANHQMDNTDVPPPLLRPPKRA
jgi:hypothetical protein